MRMLKKNFWQALSYTSFFRSRSTPEHSSDELDQKSDKADFRPDIEGLRGVAVFAVLLYHAGVPFAGGGYVGVDVFFVISGYLITGLLFRELEQTGAISLLRFYSRRAKRLLPLTVVVLVAVVAVSWPLFDPVRMEEVSWDVISAGLYVMNWTLAFQATDYFAAGLQASPVQHFWTLAVEEQFYLVWPTLLLAVAWWHRRDKENRDLRTALAVTFAFVAVASFAYGVYATEREAGVAYFSTLTRVWELALGGLLALVPVSRLRWMPRWATVTLSSAGLGMILFSTLRFSDDTLFPGTAALIPTLGTAAIIVAGFATFEGPSRFLTLAPMRHIGRVSYSWYLWHWPPLVFAAAIWGELSTVQGLAVVAASYIPAVLTHHLVERPLHHSRMLIQQPRKALMLGGACTASSVVLGLLLLLVTPTFSEPPENQVAGAAALQDGHTLQKTADAVLPAPSEAKKRRSQMYTDNCHVQPTDTEFPECVYGNPSSETTVVVFGDSHAMSWFPALNELAKKRDWRLVGLTKSSCPPATVRRYAGSLRREYHECEIWREKALQRIEREEPNLVVTGSLNTYALMEGENRLSPEDSEKALEKGYISTLEKLRGTGAEVAVMKDIPKPDKDIPECVSKSLDNLQDCAFSRSKSLDYPPVEERAAKEVEDVRLVDPIPMICPTETCPAVIGDTLVYRNGAHITPTYMRTLAPWLEEQLPEPDGA